MQFWFPSDASAFMFGLLECNQTCIDKSINLRSYTTFDITFNVQVGSSGPLPRLLNKIPLVAASSDE